MSTKKKNQRIGIDILFLDGWTPGTVPVQSKPKALPGGAKPVETVKREPQVGDIWEYGRTGSKWKLTSIDESGSALGDEVGGTCSDGFLTAHGFKDGSYSFVSSATPPAPVVIKKVNHVAIVVDKSGSMDGFTEAARKALNKTLDDLAVNSRQSGQSTYVSLYEFGDTVVQRYANKYIAAVEPERDYRANMGGTSLRDATGDAITNLRAAVSKDPNTDDAYLLIVITDGYENRSRRYSISELSTLMQQVQATDRWTLTFLLPPGEKRNFIRNFAVPEGNVSEWEQSTEGIERASVLTSQGLSSYFAARSVGATKSTNFYVTTDASKITAADLSKLPDISGQVKVWQVDKEVDIIDFVKEHGKEYRKGVAFYQLTKTEKNIQDYKKLLLMEKGKKSVYAGPQVRALLGLPVAGDAKVEPGNHSNFDVFVQSTSLNRKLVRGTKVVYDPSAAI